MTRFILLLTVVITTITPCWADKTPSDVFQLSSTLYRQVMAYKTASGDTQSAKVPPVQSNKLPTHVFAKALEVRRKINILQVGLGLEAIGNGIMPPRNFSPGDVFKEVEVLTSAMTGILNVKAVSTPEVAPFVDRKTPSEVYEKLWQVSFLLDTLVGAIDPSLVYESTMKARKELQLIAEALNFSAKLEQPEYRRAEPKDVTIEGFRNMYRLAKLERALNMKATRVGDFPVGQVTPSEAYDAVNNMLAELVRIKVKLDISEVVRTDAPLPEGLKPGNVLVNMEAFGQLTNALIAQLRG